MRDATFTSSFLEKLNRLVQSIDPGKLPARPDTSDFSTSGILLDRKQFDLFWETSSISSSFQDSESDDESLASPPPSPSPPVPPPRAPQKWPIVPRLSLEVGRSEMDDRLEEIESAIDALIMHWERWPGTGDDDARLETGKMSQWHQGHPFDLNDEYLHEDPSYDDVETEREALRDYQAEHREVGALLEVEPAGNPKQEMDSLVRGSHAEDVSREQPVSKYLARLPCGKLVPLKKLSVSLRRLYIPSQETRKGLGHDLDTDTAGKGEEAAILLRWKLCSGSAQRNEPNENGQSIDRSKRLHQYREMLKDCPKAAGGHGQVSSESSCSSSLESRSSKRYPFRQRQKTVRYTSGSREDGEDGEDEEDEENAWQCSGASSEEERSSEEEGERPSLPVQNLHRKETLREGSRHYTCCECGQEFNNSSDMWKHLRIHKGEKPYACQECGKSYSDPSNLTRHQLAHTDGCRYRCSLCPNAYYFKPQLDAHFRYHKGIRAFPCLECESSFFSQLELLRHMNIHVFGKGGHRPQSVVYCEDCGQTYANRKCLQRHRRRHRRFECEICGKCFSVKYKYKFHMSCHTDPCKQCGVAGLHLCKSQRPKVPVGQDISAASGVKGQLPSIGRGPPKASRSHKRTVKLPCPKTSSALTCHLVPTDGREVLPNLVGSASPKEPTDPIPGPTEPSQQAESSPLIIPMLPADKTGKPDPVVVRANLSAQQTSEKVPLRCPETLPQLDPLQIDQVTAERPQGPSMVQKSPLPATTSFLVPVQVVGGPGVGPTDGAVLNQIPPPMVLMVVANPSPLPTGGSVWNMPILRTVNPNQPSAKQWNIVSQQAQPLPGAASPAQSIPPRAPVPVANLGPSALRNNANNPLSALSGAKPAEDLIVINPTTLPPGTKITLEIPPRKTVPSIPPPQMCHLCGVKYLREHRCKIPLSEPVRRGEQETSQSGLQDKNNIIISPQLLAAAQRPRSLVQVTSQDGQEPSSIQSGNFQEACSEIIYIDGEEGSHGVDQGPSSTKTYDFKEGQSDMIYIDGKEGSHGVDQGPSSTKSYDFRKTHSEIIYIDGKERSHVVDQGPSSTKTYNFQKARSETIYIDRKERCNGVDQEPSSTKTYNLRKACSEVIYVDGEEGSDVERDTDGDWPVENEEASELEEDEILVVSHGKKHHRRSSSGERGPAKRRKGRYSCHLCNKRFVYIRSLKQHLRLHRAFSCDQCNDSFVHSKQLEWHRNTRHTMKINALGSL